MFYQEPQDPVLRFGDIVTGFISSTPTIEEPVSSGPDVYSLEVSHSHRAAVLTPCCSIGDRKLCLAPLIKILPKFFENPYFEEDFTRINRKMPAEKTVSPTAWKKMGGVEREKRMSLGNTYAFSNFFVYEQHLILPTYILKKKDWTKQTGYYMIDFKTMYRIDCDKVIGPENSPLNTKILQLCKESRASLREKIAEYFARIPPEDQLP